MRPVAIDTLASWASAVAALPAGGPLPSRTVLVPSEAHAHALRRVLVSTGRGAALAGTRFAGPLAVAIEVLEVAGVPFAPAEDSLRPARLLSLFREDLALEHFDLELLRGTRGWDGAFARAIATLERAGLSPDDLPRDAPLARDLAGIWSRVADDARASWSSARVLSEAAALLDRDRRAWPWAGPVLAAVTGHEDVALARFLGAIPDLTLAVRRARPASPRHLARMEALFGEGAREALAAADRPDKADPPARRGDTTERDLLDAYLFAAPEALAAPDRPRSRGADGTVHLEEHAGVDAELDATAAWVARKIFEERLPLEEIAVLVPAQDFLAQLVADRVERLPFEGGSLPVYVAGGVPAVSTAAGARVAAVLHALESHLAAEALARVLPALRLDGAGDRSHLTHGEAMELAFSLGTAGGNAAHPEGALAWSVRAAARVGELEKALDHARSDEDSGAREVWRLERTLRGLRAVRPALDALVGVARAAVQRASLAALWDALGGFLDRHLLAPGEGAALLARLADELRPVCAGSLGERVTGADALQVVEEHLLAMRVARGRFGAPAVYVGTIAAAAGLEFAAVRVVGLCEGVLPSHPREDPVLPERLRASLEAAAAGRVLPAPEDRVAAQVQGLFTALRGARECVVLSAPRVDLARTEREPAALFLDAAAALARPHATTGAPAGAVPDPDALRRDAFRPARAAAAAHRAAWPVSAGDWLDRVARVAPDLPPSWLRARGALALERIDALRTASGPLGPGEGVLGEGGPFPPVPGLDPAVPISASALQQLLQCPRLFLMRRILGWREPAAAPPLREIEAAAYGSLLHRVHEELYRAHGAAIAGRAQTLSHWQATARSLADRLFVEFLSEYPLVGEEVRNRERERLRESVHAFVEYDWRGSPDRRHVGVELAFGAEEPLEIAAGGVPLHVRGFIDRVDVEGETTLVRDLKSGRPHPRIGDEAGPTPFRDVQLGLYQLAAKVLAGAWNTPRKVAAAYAYASGHGDVQERAFRDDAGELEAATERWLASAALLLRARAFPATPHAGDCTYCPFLPLCGSEAPRRAAEGLAAEEDGALARFRDLKDGEGDG
jgi:ATP-dependent helicase/nuclease subunit B